MSKPKYMLCPGYVFSRNDGDRHYIGVEKLIELYGVKREDCIVKPINGWVPRGLIQLHPRYDGKYEVPKE